MSIQENMDQYNADRIAVLEKRIKELESELNEAISRTALMTIAYMQNRKVNQAGMDKVVTFLDRQEPDALTQFPENHKKNP